MLQNGTSILVISNTVTCMKVQLKHSMLLDFISICYQQSNTRLPIKCVFIQYNNSHSELLTQIEAFGEMLKERGKIRETR